MKFLVRVDNAVVSMFSGMGGMNRSVNWAWCWIDASRQVLFDLLI